MSWNSWNDFLSMGGYAFYVWGSLLMVFALLSLEIFMLRSRRQAIIRQGENRQSHFSDIDHAGTQNEESA